MSFDPTGTTAAERRRNLLRRRSNRGFTLIEVMIALTILGVGMMALFQAIPQGRSRHAALNAATSMANEEVERLRKLPFDHADLTAGTHRAPGDAGRDALRRSWVVQDDTPVQDIKRVAVTVSYRADHADSLLVVTTMIARDLLAAGADR